MVQAYLGARGTACQVAPRPCSCATMVNWHLSELERLKIWPIADYARKQGVEPCVDVLWEGYTNWAGPACKCLVGADLRKVLDKILDATRERSRKRALCLGCLKAQRSGTEFRNCRASTRSQCVKAKN